MRLTSREESYKTFLGELELGFEPWALRAKGKEGGREEGTTIQGLHRNSRAVWKRAEQAGGGRVGGVENLRFSGPKYLQRNH